MVNLKESKEVNPLFCVNNYTNSFLPIPSLFPLSQFLFLPPPAGEGPADVSAGHVQPEQGDPQRARPGVTSRLQADVSHWRPRHRVSDTAADAGGRRAAVQGGPQPALQH